MSVPSLFSFEARSSYRQDAISQCSLCQSLQVSSSFFLLSDLPSWPNVRTSSTLATSGTLFCTRLIPHKHFRQVSVFFCSTHHGASSFDSHLVSHHLVEERWIHAHLKSFWQICYSVVVLKAGTCIVPKFPHFFRCADCRDTDCHMVCNKKRVKCVSLMILHTTDPSDNSPKNFQVTFQFSFVFPHPCRWISRTVQLDFRSPLR